MDKEKLEGQLSKKILDDKYWGKVNDYSVPAKKLVTRKNRNELLTLSEKSIHHHKYLFESRGRLGGLRRVE